MMFLECLSLFDNNECGALLEWLTIKIVLYDLRQINELNEFGFENRWQRGSGWKA